MHNPSCDEWQDLLPWFVAGQLTLDEEQRVRAHLLSCSRCASEEAHWQSISASTRTSITIPPAPSWERITPLIASALPPPQTQKGTLVMEFDMTEVKTTDVQRRQPRPRIRRTYPFVAAFLLTALLLAFAFMQRIPSTSSPLAPGETGFSTSACPAPVSMALPAKSNLLHLQMISPAEGWLIGSYRDPASGHDTQPDPLLMHFNQCKWTQVPLTGLHGFILTSLDMLSAEQGWAIGSLMPAGASSPWRSVVLHYQNGQWHPVTIAAESHEATGYVYNQLVMTGPEDGWVVAKADNENYVLRLQHGNWSVASAPFAVTVSQLQGVVLEGTTVWGYGTTADGAAPYIARLINDAWHAEHLPSSLSAGSIIQMSAIAANDVWAVGDTTPYAPFVLHYDGTTWTQTPLPDGVENPYPKQLVMVSAHEGWLILQSSATRNITTQIVHEVDGVWKVSGPLPAPTRDGMIISTNMTEAFDGEAWGLGSVALNPDGTVASTISDETATVITHLHKGLWDFYNPYLHSHS